MATRRNPGVTIGADVEQRTVELVPGAWYAAAIDTSPYPVSLALDTIQERLTPHFGTLRIYQDKAALGPEVGPGVREAKGANVWATGQYTGSAPLTFPLPSEIVAIEKLKDTPAKERPIEPAKPDGELPTSTLLLALGGVVVVGGGLIVAFYYWRKSRRKANGKRKKRRKS